MALLAECPLCHRKQAVKNKLCKCGCDLDKMKKLRKKVKYWIAWRIPKGKDERGRHTYEQHWEPVGYSISEARDADGKRRVQKREHRIFDIKPEANMTFKELTDWYLNLASVKAKKGYGTARIHLKRFNEVFGTTIVSQIKPSDLLNYQAKRQAEGRANKTIDDQIGEAAVVIRAADNDDRIGGDVRKNFRGVKKLLKKNANARKKILSVDQFDNLMAQLPPHDKCVVATAFYTGMRKGEIVNLTWDKVSLQNRTIQLEASDTKTKKPRLIPICDELHALLKTIPKPINDQMDQHVFLYRGVKGKKVGRPFKSIRTALTKACRKAGIPYGRFVKDGFTFHDLRHTFNTYMRKAGVTRSVIMAQTGHVTEAMFHRYDTVDEDDLKEGMSRFEGLLQNQRKIVYQVVDQTGNLD